MTQLVSLLDGQYHGERLAFDVEVGRICNQLAVVDPEQQTLKEAMATPYPVEGEEFLAGSIE